MTDTAPRPRTRTLRRRGRRTAAAATPPTAACGSTASPRSRSRSACSASCSTTLVIGGYPAFTQTKVRVDFPISAEHVDPADPAEGNFRARRAGGRRARCSPATQTAGRAARDRRHPHQQHPVHACATPCVRDPSVIGGTLDARGAGLRSLRPAQQGPDRPRHARGPPPARRPADRLVRRARRRRAGSRGRSTPGLFLNSDSRFPEIAGLARRHRRLVLRAAGLLPDQLPGRHRRGDLPRGVRAEEPVHRPDRGQHQQPRRGALDRLRPARPRGLHPDLRPAALGAAGRRHGAVADDAADDHHRHPQRAEGGAALDPRGGLRRRRLAAPGGHAPRAAAGACPAS